jgi:hypothetical protein
MEVSVQVTPFRRVHRAIIAAAALLALGAAGAQADTGPRLGSPRAGATLAVGTRPTFRATDSGDAYQGTVWLSISTFRKRDRYGRLKQSDGGTFTSMKRHRGGRYTYTPPDYSFPGWFMATPATYYWQAYHINCSIPNASRTSCHVYSSIRSFKVG